jgi:ABC-type antimicrobial peptide transport system permease subunit
MVGRNYGTYGLNWDGKIPNEDIYFEGFGASENFIETMDMRMKEGRSYSGKFGSDEFSKIILNEAAVEAMHLKDPVGKTIELFENKRQIIGVVKNFHFESLHEPVEPSYFTFLSQEKNPWFKIMVRIKGGQQRETIEKIQQLYEAYNPGFPFTYNFLDEAYQKQYETETRVAALSKYFSALAIFISCLGLFGLAAFTAQKRQKEIGIRKAVGASVNSIIMMLSKDFLRLAIIAVFIAFPIAWWAMNNWLQGFAYRVSIGAGMFFIAGASVILIALLTVSFQAIKAAIANPVGALRSE